MPAADTTSIFVARQSILDRRGDCIAFELLCRPSLDAEACHGAGEQASARVFMNAVAASDLDLLARGRPAFVNVTRQLLLDGAPRALPPSRLVVELLEDIEADAEVMVACHALRRAGYRIALDDFTLTDANAALLSVADYVKVDFLASTPEQRAAIDACRRRTAPPTVKMLAEKLENREMFDAARAEGYDCFQGFFFGRPVTSSTRSIPSARIQMFRLLQALNDPDLTFEQLESLVKHHPALALQVLRTVNSAGAGLRRRLGTMREALLLLGLQAVRRWASLLVLADLGSGQGSALVRWMAVRARFCEQLSAQAFGAEHAPRGFLLGLCSLLDALLDCPMDRLLETLPVDAELAAALVGDSSAMARMLGCVDAYERAEWGRCERLAASLDVALPALPPMYAEALRWSDAGDAAFA